MGARLLPALVIALALVAAGPAALLSAAPRQGDSVKGRPVSAVAPSSPDTVKGKGKPVDGDHPGKATGHDKSDSGSVGNGHGKAKGHDKPGHGKPVEPVDPVDRPGTANPTPGGRDEPGRNVKDPQGGRKDGPKAPRNKESRGDGGATAGRSGSGAGSPSTGMPAFAPVPVAASWSAGGDPNHEKAAAPVSIDSRRSLATELFAAGAVVPAATKRFVFPLFLTVIVVLFLLLQGWFDRKDDKLALAPVDYNEGLLTFE